MVFINKYNNKYIINNYNIILIKIEKNCEKHNQQF